MPEPIIDSVESVPSEDNGNVPIEPPKEEIKPDVPTEPSEPVKPTEPTVELYELPDGRKVDASTLTREWKENFLPDYTRKSQELAKVKAPSEQTLTKQEPTNPLNDPDWAPNSYAELIEISKREIKAELERERLAEIESRQALENEVVNQLSEVKKTDPNLNENSLFLHATKYGFRDLRLAHQNMKDMSEMAKKVQQTTAANIAKRNDPVSISPGAIGARPDPSQFATARDYLRSLNGSN